MTRLTIVCISLIVISLMFVGQSYAKIDPETIVGAWLFDEGSGKTVKDSSGNGNDGKLEGPKSAKGVFGKALEFDGKDDYVEVTSNGLGKFDSQTYSIEAWFKSNTDPDDSAQVIWSYDYTSHVQPYYSQQLRLGGSSGMMELVL